MMNFIKESKGFVIGVVVTAILLVAGTVAASNLGWGVAHPPKEEERGQAMRRGGVFFIWMPTGYGGGVRGVGGRGMVGGGPGMGK